MKDEPALKNFLKDQVNLNQSRLDNAKDRLDTLKKHLKENLEGFQGVEIQGSFATRTIIKPVKESNEYDIDLMVYLKDDGSSPQQYMNRVYECLSEKKFYSDHRKQKSRCVTIVYANQFRIDVVPCVERKGSKWICNSKDNAWEKTDGTAYRDWYNSQNSKSHGDLKRVTRLLKYLKQSKRTFTADSIVLTTLAGMAVEDLPEGKFNSLPNSLEAITEWIDGYLQKHPTANLANPALKEETFGRHWTDSQYQNFREKFHGYTKRIQEAIACQDAEKSEKLWQDLLGDSYRRTNQQNGKSSASNNGSINGSPAKPPVPKPTRPATAAPILAPARTFTPTRPYASPKKIL
jgi:hypothetical protein